LHVVEQAAVKVIGAALEHGDDIAAVYVAILRRGVRRDDPNLLQGVGRGSLADQVVLGFVDADAVECVGVVLSAIAVDGHHPGVEGVALDGVVAC
jgi:hypothetical protein